MDATSWERLRGTQGWARGKVRNVGMKGILQRAPPSLSTRIFQEKPDLRRVVRERESSQPRPSQNQNPHPFRRAKEGRDGWFLKKGALLQLYTRGESKPSSPTLEVHVSNPEGENTKPPPPALVLAGLDGVEKPFRNKGAQLLRDKPAT